jgi:magnesium transporter
VAWLTLVGRAAGPSCTSDRHGEIHVRALGYPFAMLLMVGMGAVLYGIFKYKRWL